PLVHRRVVLRGRRAPVVLQQQVLGHVRSSRAWRGLLRAHHGDGADAALSTWMSQRSVGSSTQVGSRGGARQPRVSPEPRRTMADHRIVATSVARGYPHYVAQAERKGRTKDEVGQMIRWLTGDRQPDLDEVLATGPDFTTFWADAPRPNPAR